MTGLTWLHLSDWHQKDNDFDRKVVRDALLDDILTRINVSPDLEYIDFIVFSGDVAFSGQPAEYERAIEELFDPILDACGGLHHERLFIVPGNHDMDRNSIKSLPIEFQKPPMQKEQPRYNDWLIDDSKRSCLMGPFQSFATFVKGYTGQDHSDYASICEWNIQGKKVALLGLNSAWMCGRNLDFNNEINDKGYALIGEPQIHDKLRILKKADIKIVVLHHPFDWLAEFDCNRIEDRLKFECDFILHGHQHKPGITVAHDINANYITIPSGACYERRVSKDPRYANAYSFVHLDFKSEKGVAYLRRWNDEDNKWINDHRLASSRGFCFPLPSVPLISLPKEQKSVDIHLLFSDLREWKEIHTRTQSLLDSFYITLGFLDRCLFGEAESEWVRCSSALNAMKIITTDFNIIKNDAVSKCLEHKSKTPNISKRIAKAKNIDDAKNVRRSITDIKQDLDAALKVADYQIVRLVDELMQRE